MRELGTSRTQVQQLLLDALHGAVDLLRAHRALAQRQVHRAEQLGAVVLDAPAVLLDDRGESDVRALVGGEALFAVGALAPAADEVPVLGHAGLHHLGVGMAAEGALHYL
jgi:hypothetical protein